MSLCTCPVTLWCVRHRQVTTMLPLVAGCQASWLMITAVSVHVRVRSSSCHLHGVLSQGGSIGPCDHSPLSESSGELSGNHSPSAPPVCHLGLPGSAEMADSRMASPAAEPGRLSIASIGMKHIERNYNTGTQILPGSISGFYHRDRYQTAKQLLERVFRARFIEIVDLRPLKDAANYPDLRGHLGWNSANVLLNMHDRSLRDIADRIVQALRELANRARAARGTPGD